MNIVVNKIVWPTLRNKQGMFVELCTMGAGIYQIILPNLQRVTLSNANKDQYLTSPFYYGKTIGRHAGRLVVPSYTIDGVCYPVKPFRSEVTSLHGGLTGLAMQNFKIVKHTSDTVHMHILSEDGHEGFPGILSLTVMYTLDDSNTLDIRYLATTTKPTIVNITNHAYFNLCHDQSSLDQTSIQLNNEAYLEIDSNFLIQGKKESKNTAYDFSEPTMLTERLKQFESHPFQGIDHYFFFKKNHEFISVKDTTSSYSLQVKTSYPGVVMYTFNNEENASLLGIKGSPFHDGFTLECQFAPGGIHHPLLPTSILRPSETYDHFITFSFQKQG